MKKLGQVFIFRIALSVVLVIVLSLNLYPQNDTGTDESEFLILVETTDDGIKLTSEEGCAWKNLSFTLKINEKQFVDQYGMTSLNRDKPVEDNSLANFLFSVVRTEDGLSFEGKEGTTWKKLSFSCQGGKCHQYIDQNGMTKSE